MSRSAMAAVVKTLLEQVQENEGLKSLLISTAHEDQRPRLCIGGYDHIVGLVNDRPMLFREHDGILINPDMLGTGEITEIVWRLK